MYRYGNNHNSILPKFSPVLQVDVKPSQVARVRPWTAVLRQGVVQRQRLDASQQERPGHEYASRPGGHWNSRTLSATALTTTTTTTDPQTLPMTRRTTGESTVRDHASCKQSPEPQPDNHGGSGVGIRTQGSKVSSQAPTGDLRSTWPLGRGAVRKSV